MINSEIFNRDNYTNLKYRKLYNNYRQWLCDNRLPDTEEFWDYYERKWYMDKTIPYGYYDNDSIEEVFSVNEENNFDRQYQADSYYEINEFQEESSKELLKENINKKVNRKVFLFD